MRVSRQHGLTLPGGRQLAVTAWGLAAGQARRVARCQVGGTWGQALVQALAGDDFLFLFGREGLPVLAGLYAHRWTIEQCCQNLKGRSFNLETTHLRCRQKVRKLVALVSLAYACCLAVGQYAAQKRQPIRRKNHGYPATSFSRHGLSMLRQLTRPGSCPHQPLAQLVERLADWLMRQSLKFYPLKTTG